MQGGENHSLFVLLSSLHVVNIMLLYRQRFFAGQQQQQGVFMEVFSHCVYGLVQSCVATNSSVTIGLFEMPNTSPSMYSTVGGSSQGGVKYRLSTQTVFTSCSGKEICANNSSCLFFAGMEVDLKCL